MDPKTFHRKLAPILSADVAGYSRLMQDDEAGTVTTPESRKQAIFEIIKQHRGRVVYSPGDNLLSEFACVWMQCRARWRSRRSCPRAAACCSGSA